MPAGNIPRKEHRVAYTYLVEHSDRLGVENIYSSSSARKAPKKVAKSKKKGGVPTPKAEGATKKATKVSQRSVRPPLARVATKRPGKETRKSALASTVTRAAKKKASGLPVKPARKSLLATAKKRQRGHPAIKTRGLMMRTRPAPAKKNRAPRAKKPAPPRRTSVESKMSVKAVGKRTKSTSVPPAAATESATALSQAPSAPPLAVRAAAAASQQAAPNDATFSVLTLTGKRIVVPFSPNMTLIDLQQFVQQSNGIPVEMQRYIFNGREVGPPDASLRTVGIEKDKSVYLILRLRGN